MDLFEDAVPNRQPKSKVYLSRRNLLTLLSKLDRKAAGEETACTVIKRDNEHKKYPQTMREIAVIAVEDAEYYTERRPGEMHPADAPSVFEHDFNAPIKVPETGLFGASFYFSWSQPTVGFGQCSIGIDENGKVSSDLEGMGLEWTRRALYAAVDTLIEMAKKQDGKDALDTSE